MKTETLTFDVGTIAEGMGLTRSTVAAVFRDGRHAFRWVLERFCRAHAWTPLIQLRDGNVLTTDQKMHRLRILTAKGLNLGESSSKGVGREHDPTQYLASLSRVERVYVADVTTFPDVEIACISTADAMGYASNPSMTYEQARMNVFKDQRGLRL